MTMDAGVHAYVCRSPCLRVLICILLCEGVHTCVCMPWSMPECSGMHTCVYQYDTCACMPCVQVRIPQCMSTRLYVQALCADVHTSVCMRVCLCVQICTLLCADVYTSVHMCACLCVQALCACVHVCVRRPLCMCACLCVHVCMSVYIGLCAHVESRSCY